MTEPIDRSHETNSENRDLQAQLDAITDRVLTPENIDTYASDALDDLVTLVDGVVGSEDYKFPLSGLENERRALLAAGLNPDSTVLVLDHIAQVADEISDLDRFIEKATRDAQIIVTPPDSTDINLTKGSGTFKEKQQVARLKSILFILEARFGIRLEDKAEVDERIVPGVVTKEMMRRTPYNVVDIPELNRIIDVCDEEDNVTFVFDRQALAEIGIDAETLARMSKLKLKSLIQQGEVGKAITYSDKFIEKISALIENLDATDTHMEDNLSRFLTPIEEATSTQRSINGMAIELFGRSSARPHIYKAVEALGLNQAERKLARFGHQVAPVYEESEFQQIKDWLERNAYFEQQDKPLFSKQAVTGIISEELGLTNTVSFETLDKAIAALTTLGSLGELKNTGIGGSRAPGLDRRQIDQIKEWVSDNLYSYEVIPDDYLTLNELAKKHSVDHSVIERGVEACASLLGEVKVFRSRGGRPAKGLSPAQVKIIEDWMDKEGYIYPANSLSAIDIAKDLHTTKVTIVNIAKRLEVEGALNESNTWIRFNSIRQLYFRRYLPLGVELIKKEVDGSSRIQSAIARRALTEN